MSLILDGTNGLSDVDGSAGTPAIRGSDANTGVFFGTDIVGVSTGGSERMRVDASGNVGIGTSSPSGTLSLDSTGTSQSVVDTSGDGSTFSLLQVGGFNGTPSLKREVAFFTNAASGARTERARIDSSGLLYVGKTSNTAGVNGWTIDGTGTGNATFTLASTNEIFVWNNTSTAGTAVIQFRTANISKGGISWNNSNTTYATSSDYRLKHDIQPMTGALAKVALLKPCTYKWNVDDSADEGFIAHELAEVVPQAVTGEKDAVDAEGNPQYQGIDTSFLVATLTAAIQELKAINDAQAQTIESLTARVAALEQA